MRDTSRKEQPGSKNWRKMWWAIDFDARGFPGPPLAAQHWHPVGQPLKKEQRAFWPQAKSCPQTMQLLVWILRRTPTPFSGEAPNILNGNQGVIQLASKCFHSTKNFLLEWFSLACCLRAMLKEKVHQSVVKITWRSSMHLYIAARQTADGQ